MEMEKAKSEFERCLFLTQFDRKNINALNPYCPEEQGGTNLL